MCGSVFLRWFCVERYIRNDVILKMIFVNGDLGSVRVLYWKYNRESIYILFRFRERGSWEFSGAPQATCSPKIYLLPNLVVFS